jgi:hypothetical protein
MNWLILIVGYVVILGVFLGVNVKTYKGEDDEVPWVGNMLLMMIFELLWVIIWANAFGV